MQCVVGVLMRGGLGLTLTRGGASKFGQGPRGRLAVAVQPRKRLPIQPCTAFTLRRCNLHYSLLLAIAMLVRNDDAWVPLPPLHLDLSGPMIEAYETLRDRRSKVLHTPK